MSNRQARVAQLRHVLLELHKALLDAQRIEYERARGRIETRGEFLGLVLNHPEFEWIRALSALIAQMDEWAEEAEGTTEEQFDGIVEALRALIRPEGTIAAFSPKYWHMVNNTPDVTVAHVKAWRLVEGAASGASASSSPRAPGGRPAP
jgi:hypothetical protein